MSTNDKLREEVRRIMPILERLEDSPLWDDLSAGTGVATLNGLREALAASKPEPSTDIHSCHPNCYRPECVAERDASKPEPQAQAGEQP